MKLSILIVNWNTRDMAVKCVNSILQNRPDFDFEIIVVDNGSKDGSAETLANFFGTSRDVRIVKSLNNLGFAKANNRAYKLSRGEYVLLLNPDTEVRAGALQAMVGYMDRNPKAGIVGPKILNPDGSIQDSVRRFPGIWSSLLMFSGLHRIITPKGYLMKGFDYVKESEVDQVMGAALLTKRSIVERLGFLDENFWLWYEEVDFCLRAKLTGYKVMYYPGASVTHVLGEGFKQIPTYRRKRIVAKSLVYYFRKNGSALDVALIRISLPAVLALATFVNFLEKVFDFKMKPKP